MPLIVVGSVVSGITTATESAAAGTVYALLVGMFVYKALSLRDLPKLFGEAILSSANVHDHHRLLRHLHLDSGARTGSPKRFGLLFAQMHLTPVRALLLVDAIILAVGFFCRPSVRPSCLLTPIFPAGV